jgi:hypothetical protein
MPGQDQEVIVVVMEVNNSNGQKNIHINNNSTCYCKKQQCSENFHVTLLCGTTYMKLNKKLQMTLIQQIQKWTNFNCNYKN